jgi:putative DNA primase/helicase
VSTLTLERSAAPVVPSEITDAHVGEAFGASIAGRYLYCRALGGWLVWDGQRWKRDTTEAAYEEARRYVVDLAAHMLRTGADSATVKRVAAYRSRSRSDAVVTIARRLPDIAAEADEFDRHRDLLVCANGVVDLRTGALSGHDPALRMTKTTGVPFEPTAWHADVEAVVSVADPEVCAWLQTLFGYSATGHVSEDVLPVFDGRGSNGKTTLLEAVSGALGEYASAAPQRLLMKSGANEHPTLLADLFGRRLVTIEETAEGGSLNVDQMKALTGGSSIKARFIARDYFEFQPTHQLVVATNHRPAVNSVEHATWRRLRLVPFPHRYARPERMRPGDRPVDLKLRHRLSQPAQRTAMLAWIVAGAVRWYADGLNEPADVAAITEDWRNSEDVVHRFAEDRLSFEPDARVGLSEMFAAYAAWCENEGRPAGSLKEFTKRVEDHDLATEHHVRKVKTKHGRRFEGVRLTAAG